VICAPLSREGATGAFVPVVLPLIHEAGNPYLDWFFGDAERTRVALERWIRRPSSEYSIERVRGLLENGVLVGAYVGLGGADLAAARKADALTALKEAGREGRPELAARLAERRGLFAPVADDEFYLSNIGVTSARRGEGLGRVLLEEYLGEGRGRGHSRFRLDVDATNAPAVRLYESTGFRVIHEHAAAAGTLTYCSMVLDEGEPR
jgi:ribosomal protein S18 acetylase RimI-like enzyme